MSHFDPTKRKSPPTLDLGKKKESCDSMLCLNCNFNSFTKKYDFFFFNLPYIEFYLNK